MAPKNQMGFNSDKKKKVKAPPDSSIIYSHHFSNLIPGDVAVATESAIKALGLEFEEISTFKKSQMSSEPIEVPFVRTHYDGGDVPYGTFRVNGIGDVGLNMIPRKEAPTMILTGTLLSKDSKDLWVKLIQKIEEIAKTSSIYRGKAVRVSDPNDLLVPEPLDLSKDYKVIFDRNIESLLDTCILWPIGNRAMAAELGLKTKRGALLDGRYGCGKSLLLYNAAKIAHANGWTVLNMDPGMIFAGVALAPRLEPVCLIVEDVDAGTHGDRDYLNGLLNSLSSVSSKCARDMILLVSTNFLERIDPALLRPERIDAVIRVPLPNRDTIERLVVHFAQGRLSPDLDMDATCAALSESTPAIISEIIERACIDAFKDGGNGLITTQSILGHNDGMTLQREMSKPEFRSNSTAEKLARSLYRVTRGED